MSTKTNFSTLGIRIFSLQFQGLHKLTVPSISAFKVLFNLHRLLIRHTMAQPESRPPFHSELENRGLIRLEK